MKVFRKIIPVFFSFAIIISCCIPSVYAVEVGTSGTSFWDWVAHTYYHFGNRFARIFDSSLCPDSPNENGRHNFVEQHTTVNGVTGNFYICQYCGRSAGEVLPDAYDDVVDDMQFKSIDSDGGVYWQPTTDDVSGRLTVSFLYTNLSVPYENSTMTISGGSSVGASFLSSSSKNGGIGALNNPKFVVPLSGVYTVVEPSHALITGVTSSNENLSNQATGSTGITAAQAGEVIPCYFASTSLSSYVVQCTASLSCPLFKITNILATDLDDTYTPSFRATSITGDYSVVGDNNEVFVHDETLFDESTNTFYNPISGDTTVYESWTYDYSTRTYTMNDGEGGETTLTYGDDNIVINDGGNTFNLYYGNVTENNGSGGNGSVNGDSSDTGILGRIGQLLGTLVSGLLDGLTAFFSAILDSLIALAALIGDKLVQVEMLILGWFESIPRLFTGFLGFLNAIFPFIPEEAMLLLTFGIATVTFVAIIKALRR